MGENAHVVVVAAGRGRRAGEGLPKQYRAIGGETLLARTLRSLLACPTISGVTTVIHPDDLALYEASVAPLSDGRLARAVFGGQTRQDSVRLGLASLEGREAGDTVVLIHDGARPFATPALVARLIEAARTNGAAVPGVAATDTFKQVDAHERVVSTPDRASLRAVQTPQAFRLELIRRAHRRAAEAGRADLTDDAGVAEWDGHTVQIVEGEAGNMKVTTPEDFAKAEARLLSDCPDVRIGQGYDVHAFTEGDHVWLGGCRIAHDRALLGHSDADVVLHAITDAILGAIADGDIGAHFPPSQERWKGAASDQFLVDAVARVRARGGFLAHLDATVVCEEPKIGPHREAMRVRIAEIAGLPVGRVAVKATTSERLGFTGRREGIAALALATVRLPYEA